MPIQLDTIPVLYAPPAMMSLGRGTGSVCATAVLPSSIYGTSEHRWYVAHTKSSSERVLAKELCARGIPYVLPMHPATVKSGRSYGLGQRVLFPGYLFFFATTEDRYLATQTKRVATLLDVRFQSRLVTELDAAVLACGSEAVATMDRIPQGTKVKVCPPHGLAPLVGVVEVWRSHCVVACSIGILGRSVSVEIDSRFLEVVR